MYLLVIKHWMIEHSIIIMSTFTFDTLNTFCWCYFYDTVFLLLLKLRIRILLNRVGRESAELECKCTSCTGMAIHARAFGSTEAGRDAAKTGASECIVGILIRLVVYVKTIVIPLYLVCCFVGNKLQSVKIWPYTPLWGSFDREETAQLQQHFNTSWLISSSNLRPF